jgi:hypothetical protein
MAQTALADYYVRRSQASCIQPENPDIAIHKAVDHVEKYPNTWIGRLNRKFAASKVGFPDRVTICASTASLSRLPPRAAGHVLRHRGAQHHTVG